MTGAHKSFFTIALAVWLILSPAAISLCIKRGKGFTRNSGYVFIEPKGVPQFL
jgi:hypothetical protein